MIPHTPFSAFVDAHTLIINVSHTHYYIKINNLECDVCVCVCDLRTWATRCPRVVQIHTDVLFKGSNVNEVGSCRKICTLISW